MLPLDWPRVGGAIGFPTFERLRVTIDLSRRRLVLDAAPGPGARELRVWPKRLGLSPDLFVQVRAPARPPWLEVDTANTGPVGTPVVQKAIRFDGDLGAPFFAARPLTLDLAVGRAWLALD